MIRSIVFTKAGETQPIIVEKIPEILKNKRDFLWVDVVAEPDENCKNLFQGVFNFHSLAIDDALQETHVPKVDDWSTYLYMVLLTARKASQDSFEVLTPELDVFLGSNYLVTYHKEAIASVDAIWALCLRDQRYMSKGPGFILYQISDEIVSNTMSVIEDAENLLDQIEDVIFTNPQPAILEQIFSVKRTLLGLRSFLLLQREVFNKLARGDFELIPDHERVYFRDAYDHMVRVQEINESLRDLINSVLEIYLSVVNNRMNEIMKLLTIIATIFIPLSFFTGIYGMNFTFMPELQWRWGYFFFLGFIGLILIGMLVFFRRKQWI